MSSKFFTTAAVLVVLGCIPVIAEYGSERLSESVAADRDRQVRNACNVVSRLVPIQLRDGMATTIWGGRIEVQVACWAKGTDGRWMQVSDIFGPDADAYPSGLRRTYYDALGETL